MKPVNDPSLLAQLNGPSGPQPVNDPATLARLELDMDVTGPEHEVRASIEKLKDPAQRTRARRLWADAYVARERAQGGAGMAIDNTVRTLARGSFVGPVLDELSAATANPMATLRAAISGDSDPSAAPYYEALEYQRARDRAVDQDYPVMSTVGKLAGGLAGGVGAMRQAGGTMLERGAGALAGGPLVAMTPAATIPGRIAQGTGVGAGFGAAAGFGEGEGDLGNRAEKAGQGALVGGALGTALGVGAETVRAVRTAAANQGRTGAYDRMASQIEDGVDTFANQVATGSARNDLTIQRRTLDILGEEMERAGGAREHAIASTVQRIINETGVAPGTARAQINRLAQVHRDSPLLFAEYAAAAPSNAVIRSNRNPANIDINEVRRVTDTSAHNVLDDLANQPGAVSSATVRNAVNERNLGMRDTMRETLDSIAPQAGGRALHIADLEQMQEAARQAASAEYRAAYAAPTNTNLLVGLLPRILDRHANRMAGRAGEQAEALGRAINEFFIEHQGQRLAMMTLQQLQDARGVVRVMRDRARKAGDTHIVATLNPLYRDVTRLMERANPTWARANRRWADDSIDTVGRELGEAFSLKANPAYRRHLREFNDLAPHAQDMVRVEFLQKLDDKLANLGDTHDVAKLFATEHMRNIVRELFGHQAVVDIARATRDANIATISYGMTKGSQTARRTARREEADAETGIFAAAQNANFQGARNYILQRLLSIATERKNRPLANIATTPMNDVAEVARHIHNMRTAQQYRQRLEQPTNTPLVGAAAVGGAAGQAVSP